MKSIGSLHDGVAGILSALEDTRQQHLARLRHSAAVIAGIAIVVIAFSAAADRWHGTAASAVIGLVLWLIIFSREKSRFAAAFKARLMPELVRALGEDLDYYPGSYLTEEEFRECGLFVSPDRYTGSDLVQGMVGATHVRFSLVHAEEEYTVTDTVTETDSDGNTTTRTETRTEYRDVFCGLLLSADSNKHFSGRTLVTAGGNGFFSSLKRSFVSLEAPDFNRCFTVYSSDQVEARYLLTPSLMSRLMALRSRTSAWLQISFVNDRVYVAVPMALNAFIPSLWRRIDDIGLLAGYYGSLTFMVGLVEDLNLNTRIWSKQ